MTHVHTQAELDDVKAHCWEQHHLRPETSLSDDEVDAWHDVDHTVLDHRRLNPDLVSIVVPREALERLRTAWETYSDEGLLDSLVATVRDVFEGQDGHLHVIDRALGARV